MGTQSSDAANSAPPLKVIDRTIPVKTTSKSIHDSARHGSLNDGLRSPGNSHQDFQKVPAGK